MTPLCLRHPDSIFVQCRGIGIWCSPGCLLTGCTIGGKLAGQPPLPARPRTLWFLQLSLLVFFKLFLDDVCYICFPGLFPRWGSDPATPPASRQYFRTVPGDRNLALPRLPADGVHYWRQAGRPTSPPRQTPDFMVFTAFLAGFFQAFPC